jgi:hypothetical protein
MHERDRDQSATDQVASDDEYVESGGGQRYQEAHRQHAISRDGPRRSREGRGTVSDTPSSPEVEASSEGVNATAGGSDLNAFDRQGGDDEQVRPHPDDEAWLKDLGYPKTGEHTEAHHTQIEHGPNAGGSQQGHDSASAGSSGRRTSRAERE